jgi:GNAT superfamily N-acetyltransferase
VELTRCDTVAEPDVPAVHDVLVAALAVDLPEDPPPAPEDTAARLRLPWSDQRVLRWVARDGGRVVGYAQATLPTVDNTHLVMPSITVHPAARRRGVGTELLRACVEAARAEGRSTVVIEAAEGTAGAAFCTAVGMPAVQTERASLLRLSEVDWADVLGVAAAPHPGYRLVAIPERCPDELAESYARAKAAMNDAPVGGVDWHDQTYTVDWLRETEDVVRARGAEWLRVVAVHSPTGEVAGLTEVSVSRWSPRRSQQEDTGVLAEHRGHGLGLWVKAEMLRRLRAERPAVAELVTWNDEANEHMWRINARLGFRPYVHWTERQARVDELAARLGAQPASAGPT